MVNAFIVDKVGRKNLLSKIVNLFKWPEARLTISVFGLTGDLLALIGECITVSIFQRTGSRSVASVAVFFLFLHIALFSLSLDATSYIYSSEIFPTPVRARGVGISMTGIFMSTIVFLQVAPVAFAEAGWKYYLLFVCITTIMIVTIWLYFPEVNDTPSYQVV